MKSGDEKEKPSKHDPGRRNFLKGVGIAGAGAAIADHLWTEAEAAEQQATPSTISGDSKAVLNVNGQPRTVQVEPRTTLLDALRYGLDLTGAKPVCTDGSSGAATVLVDGKPMQANTMLAMQAVGKKIATVESLANDAPIVRFVNLVVFQAVQDRASARS